ncbi:MAG TPA: hypothetical protein VFD02_00110 [Syntrophomonadaceae bacterium]|nr:hypothetical protein [Syntrophomonadaceae bacterium]
MLFKSMGIAFIIGGFGFWGLIGAKRMEKRVRQLKDLRLALGFLEKEITYNYTPLSLAMEKTYKLSPKPINLIFRECSLILKNKAGVTGVEAWGQAIDRARPNLELQPEDQELLLSASTQLGMSDIYEQRKFLTYLQEELKIQEEKAIEKVNSAQKLWTYGGFILGILVVILLV